MTSLCISPNTNVESTWLVPGLAPGGVFYASQVLHQASGKGINLARAMQILGKPTYSVGFVARDILGEQFIALAAAENILGNWLRVEGEGRQAIAIYDPCNPLQDATLISSLGPQVNEADWSNLEKAVLDAAIIVDMVALAGSLPPGSPMPALERLMVQLKALGKPVWVDQKGPALETCLRAGVSGVKINALEAGQAVGGEILDRQSAIQVAGILRQRGASAVVITLGEKGAVYADREATWVTEPLPVEYFASSVGSGDAFLAGLLAGLVDGKSPQIALRMASAAGAANTHLPGGGRFRLEDYQNLVEQVRVVRG